MVARGEYIIAGMNVIKGAIATSDGSAVAKFLMAKFTNQPYLPEDNELQDENEARALRELGESLTEQFSTIDYTPMKA